MKETRVRPGSGLLVAVVMAVTLAGVFAFVPLVPCQRCDRRGRYTADVISMNGVTTKFDYYCDCGHVLFPRQDRKPRISFLKSLRRPRPLAYDAGLHEPGR